MMRMVSLPDQHPGWAYGKAIGKGGLATILKRRLIVKCETLIPVSNSIGLYRRAYLLVYGRDSEEMRSEFEFAILSIAWTGNGG